jgi:hypothetical protein
MKMQLKNLPNTCSMLARLLGTSIDAILRNPALISTELGPKDGGTVKVRARSFGIFPARLHR